MCHWIGAEGKQETASGKEHGVHLSTFELLKAKIPPNQSKSPFFVRGYRWYKPFPNGYPAAPAARDHPPNPPARPCKQRRPIYRGHGIRTVNDG